MAITVTAAETGAQFGGIMLRVYALTGATLAGTPATGTFAGTGLQQASITTTVTGSMVYGAIKTSSTGQVTALANTTVPDNIIDVANTEILASCYTTSATVTPGATTVGSDSPSVGGQTVLLEVVPAGTIMVDASSPAVVSGITATSYSVTTASFTPPGGALLVAIACADANGSSVVTVSDSSSLTWTERVHSLAQGGVSGYAGVWTAAVAASGVPAGNAPASGAAAAAAGAVSLGMTIRGI